MALGIACDGDSAEPPKDRDVTARLDRALGRGLDSADVKLDVQLQLDGSRGLDGPLRLQAAGAYVGRDGGLPALDLDIEISAQSGQRVQSGLLSTGVRSFVKFGGRLYEQPPAKVARVDRELRRGNSLRRLDLDPRAWVVRVASEGDGDVAGVASDHLSGRLAVRRLLGDLNRLAKRYSSMVGGTRRGGLLGLTAARLDSFASYLADPSFDIHVGKRDGIVRRVSMAVDVKVPKNERAALNGLEAATLRATLELSDVNGDQHVEAPAKTRSIANLSRQLGGLGTLGQGLGAALGGPDGAPAREGGGADGPRSPDPATLERYSSCVDRAAPDDTAAITRCGEILK